jgi:FtsH-binding integral membrane protein
MEQQELNLQQATSEERALFYKKTYTHLALAFLVFIGVEMLFLSSPTIINIGLSMTQGYTWLIVLGGFMFITTYAEKLAAGTENVKLQYAGFLLYIVAEAFIFVPLLYMAIYVAEDPYLLEKALVTSLALFTSLTAVVVLTGKDFSFLKSILTVGFIVALGIIIAGMIFGFDLGLVFMGAMVLLAAGSILYQTSNIIHKYHSSQYVLASLGLFASFMLLLWYVISIFLSRD